MTYKSKYLYWYKLVWMKKKTLLAKIKQMACNLKKIQLMDKQSANKFCTNSQKLLTILPVAISSTRCLDGLSVRNWRNIYHTRNSQARKCLE